MYQLPPPRPVYRRSLAITGSIIVYILVPLALLVGAYTLNAEAHKRADEAHRIYCEIARENCDPFYQQIP